MNNQSLPPETEPKLAAPKKSRRYGGPFFYIAIVVHLLFFAFAAWYVVQQYENRRMQHAGPGRPPGEGGPVHFPKPKQPISKPTNPAPSDLHRLTTTGPSKIGLPDNPPIAPVPLAGPATPQIGGPSGGPGDTPANLTRKGPGNGDDTGFAKYIGSLRSGPGLVGTLYDLKQGPNLRANEMAPAGVELNTPMAPGGWEGFPQMKKYTQTITDFVRNGWSPFGFSSFYKAPNKLTATQIFIPQMLAAEAPKAFSVEKTVSPRRWVIHYTATIIPPKDGEFRFVGSGDDLLLVRIDGKTVLDANFPSERVAPEVNAKEPTESSGDNWAYYKGGWFNLRKNSPVKMDVLIGEGPGGHLRAFLLIDEKAAHNAPGDYAVFQLKDEPLPKEGGNQLPRGFKGKTMVFGVSNSTGFTGF